MSALLLAFALALQAPPSDAQAAASAAAKVSEELSGAIAAGAAPTDPFGLVSWCAGATEGYLRLKPEILPEVRRIESQFRRPGSSLEEDMKDYADMEKDARRQMRTFQKAILAQMQATGGSVDEPGRLAYRRGLAVWAAPANSTKARIAQEWMSWSLPAKCEPTAVELAANASLLGAAMKPGEGGATAGAAGADTSETTSASTSALPEPAGEPALGSTDAVAPEPAPSKPVTKTVRKAAPTKRKPTAKPRP